MRNTSAIFLLLFLMLSPLLADEKADATASAEAFLAQIDAGQYEQAYKGAAKVLAQQVDVTKFGQGIEAAKQQVGARSSRKFDSATLHNSLPRAGEGTYYMVKWTSSFANLPSGKEIVMVSLEEGVWKLAGYGMTP